jgi:hypothetical protein
MRTPTMRRSGVNHLDSNGKMDFFFFLRNGTFIMNIV